MTLLTVDNLDKKKEGKKKHRVPKTKKEIYKISKMNKMMYKQKRKANVNKENRDEENKMNKSNIIELLKECSDEDEFKAPPHIKESKHRHHNSSNFCSSKPHLNNSSIDFIKSIGWITDKTPLGNSKNYSKDYDKQNYDNFYKQNYHKQRGSWANKGYYSKSGYYDKYDYRG